MLWFKFVMCKLTTTFTNCESSICYVCNCLAFVQRTKQNNVGYFFGIKTWWLMQRVFTELGNCWPLIWGQPSRNGQLDAQPQTRFTFLIINNLPLEVWNLLLAHFKNRWDIKLSVAFRIASIVIVNLKTKKITQNWRQNKLCESNNIENRRWLTFSNIINTIYI